MSRVLPHSDALVFFGATGDLARKQIFPALQTLIQNDALDVPVIGVAKAGWGVEQLRERAHESLEAHGGVDRAAFDRLVSLMSYIDGDYAEAGTFRRLRKALGPAQHPVHYLAIPPTLFATVVEALQSAGCADGARIVVEKPFGRDLASAQALNDTLHSVFPERAIFRIDHYLGKEPIQNLNYFRFANSFLEPLWNRDHVASVEITIAESFGVQGRGAFYDEAGAIRDVMQNHSLQILALLAAEPPLGRDAEAERDAKAATLKAIRPLRPADVVRGQFAGYHDEPGVAARSTVETFAAARFAIDSWRWSGVPFLVRVGKELPVTAAEVYVRLKRPPYRVFDPLERREANHVRFRLQPEVAIGISARVKQPGPKMIGETRELRFFSETIEGLPPYARLLGDAMAGDAHLFAREDAVEAAWAVVDPVLGNATPVHPYEPGHWGPPEAAAIAERIGGWHDPVADEEQ